MATLALVNPVIALLKENRAQAIIGDVVNVADRLQSLAGPGEIYVGSHTRALIAGKFEVEELGERTQRGRTAAEHLFKLLRHS
ncbi:MAG: adenylate/guanylate cyclase domain-containing protein [Myxococcaceae bacterium]